jgi:hypothetical protein
MEIYVTPQCGCIYRIENRRKDEATQPHGKQRRRSSLAASDQKVAPAKVNRILRFRWLSLTHDLRMCGWNRNLTVVPRPVKLKLESPSKTELGQKRVQTSYEPKPALLNRSPSKSCRNMLWHSMHPKFRIADGCLSSGVGRRGRRILR